MGKERPILFSGPMVRAILEGRKTQTRRLVAGAHGAFWDHGAWRPVCEGGRIVRWATADGDEGPGAPAPACPYGVPGDRLWVREAWAVGRVFDLTRAGEIPATCGDGLPVWYAADGIAEESWANRGRWRPSIHMPRWASRILLEVTDVRVQRLQSISEDDAKAEGVEPLDINPEQPVIGVGYTFGQRPYSASFACLWDEINEDRAPWSSNPWVWVVSFRPVEADHGR